MIYRGVLLLCVCLFFSCSRQVEKKVYINIASVPNEAVEKPVLININKMPLDCIKTSNHSLFADISQFLVKGENIIEIGPGLDFTFKIYDVDEMIPFKYEVKDDVGVVKFKIGFKANSILQYADKLDSNYSIQNFLEDFHNIDENVFQLNMGYYRGKKVHDLDSDAVEYFSNLYPKFLKGSTFRLNEGAFIVTGPKLGRIFNSNMNIEFAKDFNLYLNRKDGKEYKVTEIAFCKVDGKLQLMSFAIIDEDK